MDTVFSSVNAMRAGYLAGAITCGTVAASTFIDDENEKTEKVVKGILMLNCALGIAAMGTALARGTSTALRTGMGQWVIPAISVHLSAKTLKEINRDPDWKSPGTEPSDLPQMAIAALVPISATLLTNSTFFAPIGTGVLVAGFLHLFPDSVQSQDKVAAEAFLPLAAIFAYGLFQRYQAGEWMALAVHGALSVGSLVLWRMTEDDTETF